MIAPVVRENTRTEPEKGKSRIENREKLMPPGARISSHELTTPSRCASGTCADLP